MKTLVFRLQTQDPFQAKLDRVFRSLPHGVRNRFLVNLCYSVLGDMLEEKMNAAMVSIGYRGVNNHNAAVEEYSEQIAPSQTSTQPFQQKTRADDDPFDEDPGLTMLGKSGKKRQVLTPESMAMFLDDD